ncbi:unnamed protein product [Paramecium pentaurelia]|uniref:non-specific serine/threonine protein kinase n=1 Tax=Paramecium pentaurelia TaxID=43138 RepID=A0A8S1TZG8_9CILI|nr:unnamed protein product [Paramecium pentaurelia]
MSQYDLIIERIAIPSGQLYEMEEKTNEKKIQLLALSPFEPFHQNFLQDEIYFKATIQKTKLLRHYLRCLDLNKKYYIFEFAQGQPISQIINKYRVKSESIPIEKINNYLKSLLEALYQLHKMNILGRVFSIENIIELQDNSITLMDFGFAAELKQNQLNILAPPEVVSSMVEKNDQGLNYSIEIDSWLLGAFLFNLVKLYPINSYFKGNKLNAYTYSQLEEYNFFLQQQNKEDEYIKVEPSRYPQKLNILIESLLRYDSKKRLSFLDIYQSEYIQDLELEICDEQIQFYKNLNLTEIQKKIMLRDGITQNEFISTNILKQPLNPQSELKNLQVIQSYVNDHDFKIPQKICLESVVPDINQFEQVIQNSSHLLKLPFFMENQFEVKKFQRLFQILNLEQFRFFILNNTADEVVSLLSNKKFGFEYAIEYFLKKMAYLIMIEILGKLNSQKCQFTTSQEEWQDFQKLQSKSNLINKIKSSIQENIKELKNLNEKCQQELAQSLQFDENIRNSVKQDKHFLQGDRAIQTNIFGCTSNEFLKSGYRNMTQYLYNYLVSKCQFDEMRTKQFSLILKTVLCHLINRIFDYDQINTQFKNIKFEKNNDVTPEKIFNFIESKDNDEQKIQEIQYLVNKYFQNSPNN